MQRLSKMACTIIIVIVTEVQINAQTNDDSLGRTTRQTIIENTIKVLVAIMITVKSKLAITLSSLIVFQKKRKKYMFQKIRRQI